MLTSLHISGFKSIRDAHIELRGLNVLIGANGAGKSNLISFFSMLNEIAHGRLQHFVGVSGRAQSLLYNGPKVTASMAAELTFSMEEYGEAKYSFVLMHARGDTLVFEDEIVEYHDKTSAPIRHSLGSGHAESKLSSLDSAGEPVSILLSLILNACAVYHVHDVSPQARIKQYSYLGDSSALASDAGNIASVLYRLRQGGDAAAYKRIVRHLQIIAPFFRDFVLEPSGRDGNELMLDWTGTGSNQVFGPHQLSDGTLRALSLITILMLPGGAQPEILLIDEPELGLHPQALTVIAALIAGAASRKQIIVGTQSSLLLDHFAAESVIVVNRVDDSTQFVRLKDADLTSWLEEYTLGEVWEKNVFGGGPYGYENQESRIVNL